mgnify:FL=1|jgi:hypothetical protein
MIEYSTVIQQLTLAELSERGFSSEVMEYLATNGVTKDAVVLHMEQFPDATLEATIGTLLTKPEEIAEAVAAEGQESPVSEVAAE